MKTTDAKTAKIYAFPPGGKRGLSTLNQDERADRSQAMLHPTIEFGGCWYHDEAMAQAAEKKKH